MEEIGDNRLYIIRERESVDVCLLAYSITIQRFGLLGNRDGSDQSALFRNSIRLFFFRISTEMDVHT